MAEEKRIKALKEKHYKEKVQAKLKATAPKKKKSKPATAQATQQPKKVAKAPVKKQEPKKGLRRLWAWLNGELDLFKSLNYFLVSETLLPLLHSRLLQLN